MVALLSEGVYNLLETPAGLRRLFILQDAKCVHFTFYISIKHHLLRNIMLCFVIYILMMFSVRV